MAYTVDFTNGTKTAITVANSAINTSTNIGLLGQGYKNYGEVMAENLLHMLEHFAGPTAPSKPVEGQIWYDTANKTLMYFDNVISQSGNWKPIASMAVQPTAPTGVGEIDGQFWLDTDTGILYIYYSGSWIPINDVAGDTRTVARTRYDTNDITHRTLETLIGGDIVSIVSTDDPSWIPQNNGGPNTEYQEDGVSLLSAVYPSITAGITLNTGSEYFFTGTATRALYADLAERYHADAFYEYGTVVKIGGEKEITQTTKFLDSDVFGVVSDKPAYGMNSGAGTSKTHPYVALAGRIPLRVIGLVNKGDRLVSSDTPGHAIVAPQDAAQPTIIGRALENKINAGPGIVEAVVGTK
jgi:hypothetical protein